MCRSRCGNSSVTGPGRYSRDAAFTDRRNVAGTTAGATGKFNAATASGNRSEGNNGAAGFSGSSRNNPRTSTMYHHSNSRPCSNKNASRWRGPDPRAPLPWTMNRPQRPDPQCTSPIATPHSSAARTPDRYAMFAIT